MASIHVLCTSPLLTHGLPCPIELDLQNTKTRLLRISGQQRRNVSSFGLQGPGGDPCLAKPDPFQLVSFLCSLFLQPILHPGVSGAPKTHYEPFVRSKTGYLDLPTFLLDHPILSCPAPILLALVKPNLSVMCPKPNPSSAVQLSNCFSLSLEPALLSLWL